MLAMLVYYTYYERGFFSLFNDICGILIARINEIMNLKEIFPILFFEHGYLSHYLHYSLEIFCVYSEGSSGYCLIFFN